MEKICTCTCISMINEHCYVVEATENHMHLDASGIHGVILKLLLLASVIHMCNGLLASTCENVTSKPIHRSVTLQKSKHTACAPSPPSPSTSLLYEETGLVCSWLGNGKYHTLSSLVCVLSLQEMTLVLFLWAVSNPLRGGRMLT